jgi:hypothetical protein
MLFMETLMVKKLQSIKLRKLLKYREIKEMKSNKMLNNTKLSSMLPTKRFKIATKLKMKLEKLIIKACMILIYKTIKSDGLEVLETKRKLLKEKVPTEQKEFPRREKRLPTQQIQMRNKLKLVIILSNIATNLSNNKDLVKNHQRKLPNNLILKCRVTT